MARIKKNLTKKIKYYIISGGETECQYFNLIKNKYKINIETYKSKGSDPISIENYRNTLKLSKGENYKTWLIIDKDEFRQDAIDNIKYNKCVSYPCFEVWLLFHLKVKVPILTSQQYAKEIQNSFNVKYKKGNITDVLFEQLCEKINSAIVNAKKSCEDKDTYKKQSTEIYKIFESISEDYDIKF